MRFSFAQFLIAMDVAGPSAKQDRFIQHTTPAIHGSSCVRRHAGYYSAESLLTAIGVGSLGRAPRSYRHLTAAIRGISQRCRRLKSQFASPRRAFVDNRKGWAVGSGGSVYSTVNGGRTWQRQESTVDVDLFDVKFVDALEGWAVGRRGNNYSHQSTAGSIGPLNAVAHSTRSSEFSSLIKIVVGRWALEARWSPTSATMRFAQHEGVNNEKIISLSDLFRVVFIPPGSYSNHAPSAFAQEDIDNTPDPVVSPARADRSCANRSERNRLQLKLCGLASQLQVTRPKRLPN